MEQTALNLSTKKCQPPSTPVSSEFGNQNQHQHDSSSRGHLQSTLPPAATIMPWSTESLYSSPTFLASNDFPFYSRLSYWGCTAWGGSPTTGSTQIQGDTSISAQPIVYETTPSMPSHPFATQTQSQFSSLLFPQSILVPQRTSGLKQSTNIAATSTFTANPSRPSFLPSSSTPGFPLEAVSASTRASETPTNQQPEEEKEKPGKKKQLHPKTGKSKRGRKNKAQVTQSASAVAPTLFDRPVESVAVSDIFRATSEQPVASTSASEQELSKVREREEKRQKQRERNNAESKRSRAKKKAKYEENLRQLALYVAENAQLRSELETEKAVNSMLRSILCQRGFLVR